MEEREILLAMFHDSAMIKPQMNRETCQVRLEEPQLPDLFVKIHNIPADSVVVKVDRFPSPDHFFKGDRGERRRADYAIISSEKKYIIYIEMKKNKKEASHIVQQLKGAECVIKYCQEIGRSFWESPSFLQDYQSRFCCIVMTSPSIPKKPSRERRPPIHDAPDRFLTLYNQHFFQFRKLAEAPQ